MKKHIARKWVAALESGRYKQTKHSLQKNGSFCCLGVLCEIAKKEGVAVSEARNGSVEYKAKDEHESEFLGVTLSPGIMRWAGMQTNKGNYNSVDHLVSLNDTWGKNFKEIAKVIKEKVDVL